MQLLFKWQKPKSLARLVNFINIQNSNIHILAVRLGLSVKSCLVDYFESVGFSIETIHLDAEVREELLVRVSYLVHLQKIKQ